MSKPAPNAAAQYHKCPDHKDSLEIRVKGFAHCPFCGAKINADGDHNVVVAVDAYRTPAPPKLEPIPEPPKSEPPPQPAPEQPLGKSADEIREVENRSGPSKRRERERIEQEAYARAREKLEAFNNDQNDMIEIYVKRRRYLAFEFLVPTSIFIILSFVINFIFDSFLLVIIFGAIFVVFANSAIKSGRKKTRSEAEELFPKRHVGDFLDSSPSTDKESEDSKTSALSYPGSATKNPDRPNSKKEQPQEKNVDFSPAFECWECGTKVEIKKTLGFFAFSCNFCGQQYFFDRPSYTLEAKITYKF